jgi:hypothetical protein
VKPSTARVLALLRERGPRGITDMDGIHELRTTRLSARIHELRWLHGFTITGSLETRNGVRYARYVLDEQPVQTRVFDWVEQ